MFGSNSPEHLAPSSVYPSTTKGNVLKTMIMNGKSISWSELQLKTGLNDVSLKLALQELIDANDISAEGMRYYVSKKYRVESSRCLFFRKKCLFSIGKSIFQKVFHIIIHDPLSVLTCLNDYLYFSKDLSSQVESEVFVVNPFINNSDLSIGPRGDKRTRICVQIITRVPEPEKNEQKGDPSKLGQKCISLVHNNKLVRAKIILVDRTVAIISSMNFCSGSSAGVSCEAGLVSADAKVVESSVKSVLTKFT